jgi:hypothetical protein
MISTVCATRFQFDNHSAATKAMSPTITVQLNVNDAARQQAAGTEPTNGDIPELTGTNGEAGGLTVATERKDQVLFHQHFNLPKRLFTCLHYIIHFRVTDQAQVDWVRLCRLAVS